VERQLSNGSIEAVTFTPQQPRRPSLDRGSPEATDTIDYVATDTAGVMSTSTRTIIIEAVALPPPTSPSASTTEATSTAQ
jgi:hypothetical protein